jgi:ABC-2 type transport system permease protein
MIGIIRRIIGIAMISSRWIVRQPLWIVQGIISIIGISVLMMVWGGLEAIKNLALAFIIIGFWGQGLNLMAQNIGWYRVNKIEDMFICSPISILEYYVGVGLGTLTFSLINLFPSFLILFYVDLLYVIPIVLVMGAISLFIGSFVGLIAVLNIKNPTNVSAITNPLYTLTVLLPPVYYPAFYLPYPINMIASIIPTSVLMELSRYFVGIQTVFNFTILTILLIIWFLAPLIFLFKIISWGRR